MAEHFVSTVSFFGGPVERFPDIDPDTPVVRITVESVESDSAAFSVASNLGGGMPSETATHAVGLLLHTLAHSLLGGATLDLTTPNTMDAS